jgi:hypothetical protein
MGCRHSGLELAVNGGGFIWHQAPSGLPEGQLTPVPVPNSLSAFPVIGLGQDTGQQRQLVR